MKMWQIMLACLGVSCVATIPPNTYRNFTQIVAANGYPIETHKVTTQDGYILTMFRIPYGRNATSKPTKVVLLQHGLLDSSFSWILNLPNESLSYIAADAGFDVWMGNSRGNRYSTMNTHLTRDSKAFWEFSWDEMAKYDLPAMIGYARNVSGVERIGYVGHSQGTIEMFAALSSNVSGVADALTTFIGFGPVATVGYETNSMLRKLADIHLGVILKALGEKEFLNGVPDFLKGIAEDFCEECGRCCADVVEAICGPSHFTNTSVYPVVASHEPGGTSVQNMIHWAQLVRSKLFQAYDYGDIGNLKHYGHLKAPVYNLADIPQDFPIALYSGGQDELADPVDVADLVASLEESNKNLVLHKQIPLYAHLDFLWAVDAATLIYPQVLELLNKYAASLYY